MKKAMVNKNVQNVPSKRGKIPNLEKLYPICMVFTKNVGTGAGVKSNYQRI